MGLVLVLRDAHVRVWTVFVAQRVCGGWLASSQHLHQMITDLSINITMNNVLIVLRVVFLRLFSHCKQFHGWNLTGQLLASETTINSNPWDKVPTFLMEKLPSCWIIEFFFSTSGPQLAVILIMKLDTLARLNSTSCLQGKSPGYPFLSNELSHEEQSVRLVKLFIGNHCDHGHVYTRVFRLMYC